MRMLSRPDGGVMTSRGCPFVIRRLLAARTDMQGRCLAVEIGLLLGQTVAEESLHGM